MSRRIAAILMLALVIVGLAACESSRSVNGGGSENHQGGRIKLGLPF